MSFEEQQRDELDALEAIYAEEYECKLLLLSFITKLIYFFLKVFNGFSATSLPRFAVTIVSEEQEEDTELDNCKNKIKICFIFKLLIFFACRSTDTAVQTSQNVP